jgi:hypothetical protein
MDAILPDHITSPEESDVNNYVLICYGLSNQLQCSMTYDCWTGMAEHDGEEEAGHDGMLHEDPLLEPGSALVITVRPGTMIMNIRPKVDLPRSRSRSLSLSLSLSIFPRTPWLTLRDPITLSLSLFPPAHLVVVLRIP